MTGKITYTPPAPPTLSFNVNGTLSVLMTVDTPTENRVSVTLECNGARFQFPISGADYTALCQNWATDQDLINFVAAKFGLV